MMAAVERLELVPMTREYCHALYRHWENDPSIYADLSRFQPFVYDEAAVNRYYDSRQEPSRVMLVLLLDGVPIGEVQLKRVDPDSRECDLGIHLQSDAYKNRGLGTRAERLAVQYAFDRLGLRAVNADAILKNTRSQRVLEKAGFRLVGEDEAFRYYRIEKQA